MVAVEIDVIFGFNTNILSVERQKVTNDVTLLCERRKSLGKIFESDRRK